MPKVTLNGKVLYFNESNTISGKQEFKHHESFEQEIKYETRIHQKGVKEEADVSFIDKPKSQQAGDVAERSPNRSRATANGHLTTTDKETKVPAEPQKAAKRGDPHFGAAERVALQAHNNKRHLHINTPDLEWDSALAKSAKQWAQHLIKNNKGQLKHARSSEFGENLFTSMSSSPEDEQALAEKAVEKWYNEIRQYNFGTGKSLGGSPTGHFTQLVWKSTNKVGVGCAQAKINGWNVCVVVGRYQQPGNMMGRYKENVMSLR